jgi:hypothetical protein
VIVLSWTRSGRRTGLEHALLLCEAEEASYEPPEDTLRVSSEAAVCAVAAWTLASSRKENSRGEATGRSGRDTASSPNDATALVCADTLPNTVYRRKPVQESGSVTRWVGVLA